MLPRRTQVYFYIWTNTLFLTIVSVSKLGIPLKLCFQNNPWDTLSPATTAHSPFRCHVGISICSTQRWSGMKGPPSDTALLPENSKFMSWTSKLNKINSLHVFLNITLSTQVSVFFFPPIVAEKRGIEINVALLHPDSHSQYCHKTYSHLQECVTLLTRVAESYRISSSIKEK